MGPMLFGKKDGMAAEDFWKQREEEIGAPVLEKTLGRVIREDVPTPLWGLFYTTGKAIYFQTFKSENWLSLMFSGGKGGRTKDETIEITRDSVQSFAVVQQKGGLFNLFRKPPLVELSWKSAENGEERSLIFEMDGNAQAFVDSFAE